MSDTPDKDSTAVSPRTAGLMPPWPKGVSGNPAGKPKGRNRQTFVREAIEAIIKGTDQQVIDAMTAAIIAKSLTGDVPAYKELLDSAYGKVSDRTELTRADGGPISQKVTVEFIGGNTDQAAPVGE